MIKLNQSRKGKLSTATPLFCIYCCSAFLSDGKTRTFKLYKYSGGIHRINEEQRYYDEDPARYERQEQEAQEQYRMEQEEMRHQEQLQQDRHAEQQEQERMDW